MKSTKETIKLSDIFPNPNNPRTISDQQLSDLADSIDKFRKMLKYRPLIVDSNNVIIGGNQRYLALLSLGEDEIPAEWVAKADDFTEEEIRRFIIVDNVPFGEWDFEKLEIEYTIEELNDFGLNLPDDWLDPDPEEENNNIYSTKIEAPTYEPSEVKPDISEIYNTDKSDSLISEIKKLKIGKELKSFLIDAAKRHTVFNYQKIADYYANSDPDVQDIFEKLALVVIDFDKAIENGYVQLTKEIAELSPIDEDE